MRPHILIVRRDSRAILYMIYLSLVVGAAIRRSAQTRDGEPTSFRICRLAVSVHGDLCATLIRRADNPREIHEIKGRMTKTNNLPRFRAISLSSAVCGGSVEYEDPPGRRFKIFQSLYVTCGLKILIIDRVSGAILYII